MAASVGSSLVRGMVRIDSRIAGGFVNLRFVSVAGRKISEGQLELYRLGGEQAGYGHETTGPLFLSLFKCYVKENQYTNKKFKTPFPIPRVYCGH